MGLRCGGCYTFMYSVPISNVITNINVLYILLLSDSIPRKCITLWYMIRRHVFLTFSRDAWLYLTKGPVWQYTFVFGGFWHTSYDRKDILPNLLILLWRQINTFLLRPSYLVFDFSNQWMSPVHPLPTFFHPLPLSYRPQSSFTVIVYLHNNNVYLGYNNVYLFYWCVFAHPFFSCLDSSTPFLI